MRLSRLRLERYKAFQLPCEIEIRPLTILVGANNAGKSALARAIPLLAGGLQGREVSTEEALLPLASFGLTHGDSFEDLIAGRTVHGSISLAADFRSDRQKASLTVLLQNLVRPGHATRQVVSRWMLALTGGRQVELERPDLESNSYRITITTPGSDVELRGEVAWAGLIPLSERLHVEAPEHRWLKDAIGALSDWSHSVRYLRSPRELVGSPFRTPAKAPTALGLDGRETPRMLASPESLLRAVRDWFSVTFGVRLEVRQQGDTSLVEVREESGRAPVSIAQAGQGLSQVLPVAIQCMTAAGAGPGVDIVEHPETELHPRAHASVADMIVEHLPGATRPVVLETHSEVLLLRIRRKVAEGALAAGDVAIYWIDRDEEAGSATVQPVEITPDGEVTNWPEGAFLEDYEEVVAIRREARRLAQQ